ncbi:zinc metalloprotease HtpX [Humibacillus xanthopallidus]|uniref:zinc metalloprotease HtpX n=1 Tax=Humibacillus xanthopallidus TaxID=412689 RepID=UPI0011515EFC|nr:zinc metalloprotease HtpX [Humibacillus xanthopallidus]
MRAASPHPAARRRPDGRRVAAAYAPAGRHRVRNVAQELLLFLGLAVVLGAAAWLLAGTAGLLWATVTVVVLAMLRPRVPTAWILSLYAAQPVPRAAAPRLHDLVDVLSERAHLERRPAVFYVASPQVNAFVVGRGEDAALAVTDGLLRLLDGRELAAVVAHEVSHLRNGDTAVMSLSDLVARLSQWMSWVGLWSGLLTLPLAISRDSLVPLLVSMVLVAVPMLVTLMQLAVSRSREYDADLDAASLTGDPEGLARALVVLEHADGRIWERILVGRSAGPDPLLLRTHPPTDERVRRLMALEADVTGQPLPTTPYRVVIIYPPATDSPRLRRTGIWW